MNALGVLANQAASEAQAAGFAQEDTQTVPAYLVGPSGRFADPSIPEHRARALLERLQEGRAVQAVHWENGDVIGNWFQRAGMVNGG